MASRTFHTDEVLEMVCEDGSDDEAGVVCEFEEEESEEDNDERHDDGYDDDDDQGLVIGDLECDETVLAEDSTSGAVSDPDYDQPPPDFDYESDDVIPPTPPPVSPVLPPVSPVLPPGPDPYDVDTDDDDELNDLIFDDDGASEWVQNLDNYPINPPFTGNSGFQIPIPEDASPMYFYELFMTNDVIKNMKAETNRYAATACRAAKRRNPNLPSRSYFNRWTKVSESEMRKFLAILIHMGLVKKPRINDYWSTNPVMASSFAPTLMSRDRFKMILAFFHLNDNANFIPRGRLGHDPLFKVRTLIDSLNASFKRVYIPEEFIALDEAVVPWRGRVIFRVYIKNKPTKWGIKIYMICESLSGYVFHFEVYCLYPNLSNSTMAVVKRMLHDSHLDNEGRTIVMDNYYQCPRLAQELLLEGTNSLGTSRFDRLDTPGELKTGAQVFTAGQMDFRRKGGVLCVRWKDKRDILMLTTVHLPQMKRVLTRTGEKEKPTCNVDYSKYMKGVDHSDQMMSYAPFHRKTIKWWKKLAFHLVSLTMVQAHCLYNKHQKIHGRKPMQFIPFCISVCSALVERATATSPAPAPPTPADRLQGRHFPEKILNPAGKTLFRACHVCLEKRKSQGVANSVRKNNRKVTRMQCSICKVALCTNTDCFEVYHTQKNFT